MNKENKKINIEPTVEVMSLEPNKRSWWKYAIAACSLVIAVLGGYLGWYMYLSPDAGYRREIERSALELPGKLAAYEKAMSEDTYGGKTPEETLQLFIEALKEGDVELASKYFALDDDSGRRNTTHLDNLDKAKEDGRLPEIIDAVSKAELDPELKGADENSVWFAVFQDGEPIADINLKLNKYSEVWKIESL